MRSTGEMLEVPQQTAAVLAAAPDQFVTFSAGGAPYGVSIMDVREIRGWSPMTALPGQPFGAIGVLDIRGEIIEVYDLASMLGHSQDGDYVGKVVLVLSIGHQDVGMLVDAVSDIIFARGEDFRAPPKSSGRMEAVVRGLVRQDDRLVAILDLAALFSA